MNPQKQKDKQQTSNIDWIRLGLAPPEEIMQWSKREGPGGTEYYAEVKKPETFNYRTYKPEKDGLFCERIFGPANDYECACGKYKKIRFRGVVCERCGVKVTQSRVRREWMGHIKLAAPVAHIWFTKSIPNRMSYLLGINAKEIEKIVYYVQYIVTQIDIEWLLENYRDIEERVQEHVRELKAQKFNLSDKREIKLWEKLERFTTDDDDKRETAHGLAEKYGGEGILEPGQDHSDDEQIAEDLEDMKDFVNSEKLLQEAELAERLIDPATNEVVGEIGSEFSYALLSKLFDAGFYNFTVESQQAQLENEKKLEELDYTISRLEGGMRLLKQLKKWELVPDNDTVTNDGNIKTPGYESFSVLRHFLYRYHEIDLDEHIQLQMGAEALDEIFSNMDLKQMEEDLEYHKDIATTKQRRRKLTKRLRVIRAFDQSGNRPEWMVLKVLPVLPPDLRPMIELDGGRFASSDLNDLYRRVINRNNRLKKLMEIRAPASILRNEKRMLQEAVDSLIDNGRKGKPAKNTNNRALKSLADQLKGKQGRFRQNLLGKRVDYSGRSVIVSGPHLKMHQCGLPKHMALELFKPFVLNKLIKPEDPEQNISEAREMLEQAEDERVWDALDDIIKNHPVLLNRAPTLHRLSIQAFEPVLTEASAIEIHPLVCPPYNADFDGDAMAVHVPLSTAAKAEARSLMLSSNNLLLPADGHPITTPSQDMVLGTYYLTQVKNNPYTEPMETGGAKEERLKRFNEFDTEDEDVREKLSELPTFRDTAEVIVSYENDHVKLQDPILIPLDRPVVYSISEAPKEERLTITTVGRVIFNQYITDLYRDIRVEERNQLPFYNFALDKGDLSELLEQAYRYCGQEFTVMLCDAFKELGFEWATRAGVTLAVSDISVPPNKKDLLDEAEADADEVWEKYNKNVITENEKNEEVIKIWDEATKDLTKAMKQNFDVLNPIWMMAESGARGKVDQVKQLSALRGLMVGPTGDVLDFPIKSNFRDGLSVFEYFVSTHGSRKGLVDTALKTADSGYLTRRLVDVSLDVHIAEEDCGTDDGITSRAVDSIDFHELFDEFQDLHSSLGDGEPDPDRLTEQIRIANAPARGPRVIEQFQNSSERAQRFVEETHEDLAELVDRTQQEEDRLNEIEANFEELDELLQKAEDEDLDEEEQERITELKSFTVSEVDEEFWPSGIDPVEDAEDLKDSDAREVLKQALLKVRRSFREVDSEVDDRFEEVRLDLQRLRSWADRDEELRSALDEFAESDAESPRVPEVLKRMPGFSAAQGVVLENADEELEELHDDLSDLLEQTSELRELLDEVEGGETSLAEADWEPRAGDDRFWSLGNRKSWIPEGTLSELSEELTGRLLAEDFTLDLGSGPELIMSRDTELDHDQVELLYLACVVATGLYNERTNSVPADLVDLGASLKVRSPLTCETLSTGVCAKCYGWDLSRWRLAEVGDPVGVVAAQSIGEPGTQLTMRTFHTGGAASTRERTTPHKSDSAGEIVSIESVGEEGSKEIKLETGGSERVLRTPPTSPEVSVEVTVSEGDEVEVGDVLYIKKEREHIDITQGLPYVENLLEVRNAKGPAPLAEFEGTVEDITKVTPWNIVVTDARESGGERQVIQERKYTIECYDDRRPAVDMGDTVSREDPLDNEENTLTEIAGEITSIYPEDENSYHRITIRDEREVENEQGEIQLVEREETYETPPENRALHVSEGDRVEKAQMLCQGGSNLKFDMEDYLELKGELETQRWLIDEVQGVYESQGVSVDTKHIEIIADRMFAYCNVEDPGDFEGEVYRGDKIERSLHRLLCKHAEESDEDLETPEIETLIQGISKASLSTDSWLAAASFQETTRVLTENSIKGKKDYLRGLKENVIVGGLIPVGTGRKRDILYQIDRQRRVESVFEEDTEEEETEAEAEAESEEEVAETAKAEA